MSDIVFVKGFICFGFDIRDVVLNDLTTEPGWNILKFNKNSEYNNLLYIKREYTQTSGENIYIHADYSSDSVSITKLSNLPIDETITLNGQKPSWFLVVTDTSIEVLEGESNNLEWIASIN